MLYRAPQIQLALNKEKLMTTTLTAYRPSLLGRNVFDDIFDSMLDFPSLLNRTTQGYPVADIYKDD